MYCEMEGRISTEERGKRRGGIQGLNKLKRGNGWRNWKRMVVFVCVSVCVWGILSVCVCGSVHCE
jgi:hypothetical protein